MLLLSLLVAVPSIIGLLLLLPAITFICCYLSLWLFVYDRTCPSYNLICYNKSLLLPVLILLYLRLLFLSLLLFVLALLVPAAYLLCYYLSLSLLVSAYLSLSWMLVSLPIFAPAVSCLWYDFVRLSPYLYPCLGKFSFCGMRRSLRITYLFILYWDIVLAHDPSLTINKSNVRTYNDGKLQFLSL